MTWSQRSLSNLARSNFRGSSPSRSALRLLLVSSGSNTITAEGETPYSPVRLSSYLSSDELRHLNTTRSLPISKNASIITFSIMSPSTKSDSSKFSLPENFLASPAPNISTQNVNFLHTDLPQYNGFYATIIDNALSKEECIALVRAAEAQTDGKWEQAMINVGYGEQKLITDARDCGRIIWDDKGVVEKIWARVKGCVPEIEYIKNAPLVTGRRPAAKGETWKMTRLNERMRFLRYGEGQYFRPHMDGAYATPDGKEVSFYTLHLYLNESDPSSPEGPLKGGATTFHSYDEDRSYDVVPKIGRVLVFQHKHLLHSGADVLGGIKLTLRTDLMYKKVETDS